MDTNVEQNQLMKVDEGPHGLIAMAIQNNLDIDKLERLLALKERYDAQQANKSFISALSHFQQNVPEIKKSKVVDFVNKAGSRTYYKHAEIGDIDEAIKQPMATFGLAKRWEISEDGDKIICTCIISHVDGHNERTTMSSVKDTSGNKNDIQSKASAITYLQRYTLIGALGLTTASEDNDGDGATPPVSTAKSHQQNNSELPWLNIRDKDGSITELGTKVMNAIAAGSETLDNLRQQFRISKTNAEELANIKSGETLIINTNKSEPIPGHWYAKLDKCKTKEDIDELALKNQATIQANPDLKKVFQQYYNSLKKHTANAN